MTESGSDEGWRPLFERGAAEKGDRYATLAEGVPDWLERSLWRWILDHSHRSSVGLGLKAERALRMQLPKADRTQNEFWPFWGQASDDGRLTLIDFFLGDLHTTGNAALDQRNYEYANLAIAEAERLEGLLAEGGSAWRVSMEEEVYWRLTRRVPEGSRLLKETATSPDTDSARALAAAWSACFRHDPDYDRAYREAVLAVEAVALGVFIPRNTRGTLGTAVSHLADTVADWTVSGLDAPQQASGPTLLAMMKSLWHNQQRHAQADGTIRGVGQAEAEAAVLLAATLTHWFAAGLVQKRDSD